MKHRLHQQPLQYGPQAALSALSSDVLDPCNGRPICLCLRCWCCCVVHQSDSAEWPRRLQLRCGISRLKIRLRIILTDTALHKTVMQQSCEAVSVAQCAWVNECYVSAAICVAIQQSQTSVLHSSTGTSEQTSALTIALRKAISQRAVGQARLLSCCRRL